MVGSDKPPDCRQGGIGLCDLNSHDPIPFWRSNSSILEEGYYIREYNFAKKRKW